MSSSLPGPSDVGSTQPGWIRTRQRPAAANAASVDSSHTLSEETEQQQATHKQVSTSAAPSSPSSGFASSFSAFFPSSSGLQYGDVSHQQSAALGDYPLFISKRGAKPPIASVASTSPPFGFSPPSPQAASLPSLSSMRPNMQLSNISAGSSISGGLSVLQNSTASRLRRPSVLATSILANEDEEDIYRYRPGGDIEGSSPSVSRLGSVSIDGHDETAMSAVGDDIDMDLSESNHNSNAQSTINLNLPRADISQTPAMAIPGRARSHSQSSSVMASSAHLARSPSAWPNSPPRSGFTPNANPQHLLARLTSEQQQAMVASASSASSAYYMIPTPYRQAMTAGNGGDLLLGGVEEEALLETPFEAEVELNSKLSKPGNHTSGLVRSFNPLNPYSERPPANSQRPRSGEADRDMMLMDDSPQQSPAGRGGMFGAFQGLGNGSAPEKQTQPGSSLLRASKSSPALAEMNNAKIATPTALVDTSGVNTVPFPTSNPATPATPLQRSPQSQDTLSKSGHSGLRRSQSASHRPAELSALTSTRKSTSRTENASAPLTAPAMSNVFRYQRANSLSDFSQLQRKAGFGTSTLQLGASQPETPQLSGPSMSSHDEQHKDRQASGSSGSESPHTAPRVVRRAVNHKKGSLMVSCTF